LACFVHLGGFEKMTVPRSVSETKNNLNLSCDPARCAGEVDVTDPWVEETFVSTA
jgi:hypothetical protein